MAGIEFWRPRFTGGRFADGEIPLEVFADLVALREMVIEVAGWRYLKENPDRQRLPRGFGSSVDLKLTGLAKGSAIPIISLAPAEPVLNGMEPPYRRIFEMAREDIVSAIGTDDLEGGGANGHLPSNYLAYFNRIGRSLRDDECLELPSPEHLEPARLTREKRERLLLLSTITEPTREITVRGTVSEVDQDRMTFELQPVYGPKITGAMPEQHRTTIVQAFNGYRDNVRVLMRGIGRYNRRGRLTGLETVEHIALLDPLDVPARLDEFRSMKDGWLEDNGLAPSQDGLDWLAETFKRYFPDAAPLPYAYPTPAGGVRLEWTLDTQEISLDIDLTTHSAWRHRLDLETDSDAETDLNLDNLADWEWLAAEIAGRSEHTE